MADFLYSVAGFIVAIGVLVTIHEYGNFWVARKVGVKVHRFSVGFGKVLKSWRRSGDPTEYVLSAIPLGGYVKMMDERVEEVPAAERDQAFNRKPLWARAAVVAAGPAANYLFAVLAVFALAMVGMNDRPAVVGEVVPGSIAEQAGFQAGDELITVDGRPVHGWAEHQLYLVHQAFKRNRVELAVLSDGKRLSRVIDFSRLQGREVDQQVLTRGVGLWPQGPSALIGEIVPQGAAADAGLQPGDTVLQVDGEPVNNWYDMVVAVQSRPNETIELVVERDGGVLSAWATLGAAEVPATREEQAIGQQQVLPATKRVGRLGVRPGAITHRYRLNPWEALERGVDYTWRFSAVSLRSIGKMFTREIGTENLSGPLTIAQFAGATAQNGVQEFVMFLVVISVSLGLINLMPIPMLDGGHLAYFLVEAIKGSPVSETAMEWGQRFGVLALAMLMSLAFYNDIIRLLT